MEMTTSLGVVAALLALVIVAGQEQQPSFNDDFSMGKMSTSTILPPVPLSDSSWTEGSSTLAALPSPSSLPPLTPDESSVDRALAWLRAQRRSDWGWGNDTAEALLALQLAGRDPPPPLETELSIKQMEVEILLTLWRHREDEHEAELVAARAAAFALALSSLCRDSRHSVGGHDLITVATHREARRDADHALAALAACNAGAHARKKHIRRLIVIASAPADHNVDTVALVTLALKCIARDHRHRSLAHFARRPGAALARQQNPVDGSFGNARATALALQALHDEPDTVFGQSERAAARAWLRARQSPDGGFGTTIATADAALALSNGAGLGDVRARCDTTSVYDTSRIRPAPVSPEDEFARDSSRSSASSASATSSRDESTISGSESTPNVTVTYSLWIGTNVSETHELDVTVSRNSTFYTVMVVAAERDSHFEFAASDWPNGHYVHTLAGHREEPLGYHYWLLYRLPTKPDPASPPANQLVAPGGVDDLLVDDGEHYLFWYKKL